MGTGAPGSRGAVPGVRDQEDRGGGTVRAQSIRKIDANTRLLLEAAMGYNEGALQQFEGRYVKIVLKSPKRIKGFAGAEYQNDEEVQGP